MIKVTVKNNIKFPKILLQDDLEYIASDIIIPDMMNRISQHKAIDGGALPDNEPGTIRRKGHGNQLRESDELRQSFEWDRVDKDKVIISIAPGRSQIGYYLQEEGIKVGSSKESATSWDNAYITRKIVNISGRKHYRFFGISVFAYRNAMKYMKEKIEERTRPSYAGEGI